MPYNSFATAFSKGDLFIASTSIINKSNLLVFVHGWNLQGTNDYQKQWESFCKTFADDRDFDDYDIFIFRYDSSFWSNENPRQIAEALESKIRCFDSRHSNGTGYEKIYLIGHSIGGFLLRAALLKGISTGQEERSWVSKVKCVLLLAATNRGFRTYYFQQKILVELGRLFNRGKLILEHLVDQPFILDVRLEWIEIAQSERRNLLPKTVQVLGTKDRYVSPDDSIDIFVYQDSSQEIIESGTHTNIIAVNGVEDNNYQNFKHFLSDEYATRTSRSQRELRNTTKPTDIIIIMHGIRDRGSWLEKLEKRIENYAESNNELIVKTFLVNYTRFPIKDFLDDNKSREKAEALFGAYIQAKALSSESTKIHFIGHSNGTYIFAKALELSQKIKFERAYLCGSVLPQIYPWENFTTRLNLIRNDCARWDLPVGFLCEALNFWGIKRLGMAGYAGFTSENRGGMTIKEYKYLKGGHGAALNDRNYDSIAKFLLSDENSSPPNELIVGEHSIMSFLNKAAPYLFIFLVFILVYLTIIPWTDFGFLSWLESVSWLTSQFIYLITNFKWQWTAICIVLLSYLYRRF
ncbi:membrane hypothetical protein [Hyella patelloides LEGE 07179]|uniref:DUF676 domain-containing protein n=1 Tax=Hyella patelloides LEGE 07179 TaxID=945734 RepID=A0A563VNW9_9CYAN|nr:hypothetical protein [Hyella patelloides]VEP13123.1 membrane hypothetical protein [Hyella patelloides LEGE 07179]